MGKKVITCELSVESIDDAIEQIEAYKKELEDKLAVLRNRLAERIRWTIEAGFTNAQQIIVSGDPPPNDVTVTVADNGNMTFIIASGEQAVFIEFGAGIYSNGAVGKSPHPWTASNPTFLIGMYDKLHGRQPAWGFYNGPKDKEHLVVTRGTPAAMPMYNGYKEAVAIIGDLAREVFGE